MLEHLRDMQSILEWHKKRGSLLEVEKEIDWKYEIASSPYRKYDIKYWQDRISLYSDNIIRNNGKK